MQGLVRRDLRFIADVITTAALSPQLFKDPEFWSVRGLNLRPPAQQTGALPTVLTGRRSKFFRGYLGGGGEPYNESIFLGTLPLNETLYFRSVPNSTKFDS